MPKVKTNLAEQLVADFWERVGYQEGFPRQLEQSIMLTVPVHVVKVHGCLDTRFIRDRLLRRGIALPTPWKERKMRGCLVAFKDDAAIFVDGTLSPEEWRVIIAHEFGHYLADFEYPRRRALRHLGNSIVEVLDGDRPPSRHELLAATLTNVQVGVFVHYMDRSENSRGLVREVEDTASIVGAELVAPRQAVFEEMTLQKVEASPTMIAKLLEVQFGLPSDYAEWHAERLARFLQKHRSFSEILGI
jgi:hypothetical protein